jgi:hypothetical protein
VVLSNNDKKSKKKKKWGETKMCMHVCMVNADVAFEYGGVDNVMTFQTSWAEAGPSQD